MLTPKMTEALEYIDAYGSAGVIHRRTLAALVSRGLIEQVGNKAAIAAGAAWHYRVTPAGSTVYSEVNRRHLGGRFTSQPDTATGISYLVIDNDPNSPECETVYEVLGTMLDGPTGLNTHVYLRSLVTDTVSRMWASEFQAYDFRALPLDQASQDRKDARDSAAPVETHALYMRRVDSNRLFRVLGTELGGVWLQHDTGYGFPIIRYGQDLVRDGWIAVDVDGNRQAQPAPIEHHTLRVLDTATGRKFAVLGTTMEGQRATNIWLRALDTQQVEHMWVSTFAVMRKFVAVCEHGSQQHCPECGSTPLADFGRDFPNVDSRTQDRQGLLDELHSRALADGLPVDDLGRRVQQTASGHWISFPSPVVEPRHEVAEHCGITDSERPATPPASADHLLGQALYFIRELTGITVRHQRSAAEQVTIERARKFLAEIERDA